VKKLERRLKEAEAGLSRVQKKMAPPPLNVSRFMTKAGEIKYHLLGLGIMDEAEFEELCADNNQEMFMIDFGDLIDFTDEVFQLPEKGSDSFRSSPRDGRPDNQSCPRNDD
jgi:hypothetical protein